MLFVFERSRRSTKLKVSLVYQGCGRPWPVFVSQSIACEGQQGIVKVIEELGTGFHR
jgi:hypothetical protein